MIYFRKWRDVPLECGVISFSSSDADVLVMCTCKNGKINSFF